MGVHLRHRADGTAVLRQSRRHVGHRPQWLVWNLDAIRAKGYEMPPIESCRLCIATTVDAMTDHEAAMRWVMRRMTVMDQERQGYGPPD